MNIFISWSKEPSRSVAIALRNWLPKVIAYFEPWMSDSDIDAGQRWGAEISQRLTDSTIGIICLTQENSSQPWVLFEAGALSNRIGEGRVIPYLYGIEKANIVGPLTQFQMVTASREGTLRLLQSLNSALDLGRRSDHEIEELFNVWWPRLAAELDSIVIPAGTQEERGDRAILEEILDHVRTQSRLLSEQAGIASQVSSVSQANPAGFVRSISTTPSQIVTLVRLDWNEIISRFQKVNKSSAAFLRDAEPLSFKDDTLTIGFFYQLHVERFKRDNTALPQLERIISSALDLPIKIEAQLSPRREKLIAAQADPIIRAGMNLGGKVSNIIDEDSEEE